MTEIAKLKIEIDGLTEQAEKMERLADAIERVAAALNDLNGKPHGGIVYQAVGEFSEITVRPVQ